MLVFLIRVQFINLHAVVPVEEFYGAVVPGLIDLDLAPNALIVKVTVMKNNT